MNILTFDIEEWYIYEQYPKGGKNYYLPIINSYLSQLLDFLDESHSKATFFCLGIIARNNPSIIKQIAERGHEIGCHSDKHILINKMSPNQFRDDTRIAIKSLQELTGAKIDMYRAPAFSITEDTKWSLDILAELEVKYDCSIFPAKRSTGGFSSCNINTPFIIKTQSGDIKEFPISYVNFGGKRVVFSGGGYFRLFPYKIIKSLTSVSDYNMAYFHIRDFDSKQKRAYSMKYFQSYIGIKSAFSKFKRYVNEFDFISLAEGAENINWDDKAQVKSKSLCTTI